MFDLTEAEIMINWSIDEPVRVSVCCITFRQEQYIEQAINSFLMQKTTFPFEILIGEDCGGDGTLAILAEYQSRYPTIIKVITSENNIGANANLLRLFQQAKGDYIAVCEGDDYWCCDEKLEIQYHQMIADKNVALSYHSAYVLRGNKKTLQYTKNTNYHTSRDVIANPFSMWAPTASYMFKKEVVDKLPAWFADAPIGDYYIEVYALKFGSGLYIDSPMSIYRSGATNSWGQMIHSDINLFLRVRVGMINCDELSKLDFPACIKLIDERIARSNLVIARWMLLNGKIDEFKFYLNKVSSVSVPTDIKNKVNAYSQLKDCPFLLKCVVQVREFMFHLKAK